MIDDELSGEALQEVERIVDEFVDSFQTKQQKEMAVKYTVMPLNQIVRAPNDQKWRNVITSNSFLKQVDLINSQGLSNSFEAIGFTKQAEKTFKFQKADVETDKLIKAGNLNNLSEAVKVLNAKLTELKTPKPAIKVNVQVNEEAKVKAQEEAKAEVTEVSETSPGEEGKEAE